MYIYIKMEQIIIYIYIYKKAINGFNKILKCILTFVGYLLPKPSLPSNKETIQNETR